MRSGLVCVLVLLTSPYARAQDSDLRAPFTIAVQGPDGTPIAGASVLLGDDRGAAADADGEARFEDVAPGRYVVRVSYVGRRSRQLRAVLNAPGPWGLIVEIAEEPSSWPELFRCTMTCLHCIISDTSAFWQTINSERLVLITPKTPLHRYEH